jgi:hypothetical protein
MTKLKRPSAALLVAINEYYNQQVSGEFVAKYWEWFFRVEGTTSAWRPCIRFPELREGVEYASRPAPAHPHYALYRQWEALEESGAVERGEVELLLTDETGFWVNDWKSVPDHNWPVAMNYKICKTDKHPDNGKPKLKLIDWSKVPVDALTNYGKIICSCGHIYTLSKGYTQFFGFEAQKDLRLAPATKWTALQDDQVPPVVEGLMIEYRYYHHAAKNPKAVTPHANMPDINAYRVTGLAEGYTDDPAKVGDV